jgi:flagellar export protein FliJ
MPVSTTLRRLLRIRELQEEQSRSALETALGEVNRLKTAIETAERREQSGRRLVGSSANSGSLTDRVAGLQEVRTAAGMAKALSVRLAEAERCAAALRDRFLASRVDREQAATLCEEREARAAVEGLRRDQQKLDDLFRLRSKNGNG